MTTSNGDKLSPAEPKQEIDIFEEAAQFMKKFEWYHDTAYWDYAQRSIWYGTKSYAGETITEEQALERYKEEIKQAYNRCKIERFANNQRLQVALISFCYNVGHLPSNTERYVQNWYLNALKNQMKKHSYAWWKRLRWLANRRQAETELF